ncbi:hypothetical protein JCM10212_001133 [Sporobolomyces blumeae]
MATAADTSDKSSMAKSNDATDSARIGWAFLSQYYSYLNKDPARLHCFYTKRSTLIHSTEGEETTACYGQQEIHAKIMSLAFEDCKVYISNVDSQSSAEGGIIVQVIGEMSNANGSWRKFAQTFFLAEQPNGYFVLNDICRYIKEEGEDEASTPAAASAAAAATATTSTSGPDASAAAAAEAPSTSPAPAAAASAEDDSRPASVESVLFNDVKPTENLPKAKEDESTPAPEKPAEAAPAPTAAAQQEQVNGANDVEKAESAPTVEPLSAVEEKSNHAAVSAKEAEAAAPEEPKVEKSEDKLASAPAAEAAAVPAPAPAASTSSTPAPTSAPASAASTPAAAPAPTPAPATPAAPKSWASLAASNSTKWGSFANANKGVSATAAQKSSESSIPAGTASASAQSPASSSAPAAGSAQPSSNERFSDQVLAVNQPACFVKGVVEFVSEKQLREVLTTRFGPLKELDIIRSKACAFIEFVQLNDARKAIQVSLRHNEGGENGITFETPSGDKARINVVERKPHNERPPARPRGAAAGSDGPGKQGQQGAKDGQRTGGGGGGRGGAARNQGGSRIGGGQGQRNQGQGQRQGAGAQQQAQK